MTRRNALRKSTFALLAAGGTSSFATTVAADSENEGPPISGDSNSPAPIEGGSGGNGFTADGWDAFLTEYDFQVNFSLPSYSNPGDIGFEVCYEQNDGVHQTCINTGSNYQYGTRPCSNGETPPLYSVEHSVTVYETDTISTQIEFWVGWAPDDDCLWIGNAQAEVCEELGCNISWDLYDIVTDPGPWTSKIRNAEPFILNNPQITLPDYYEGVSSSLVTAAVLVALGAAASDLIEINSGTGT